MPELVDATARGVALRKRPELGGRPLSSGRFCTFLCFVSFSDERNEDPFANKKIYEVYGCLPLGPVGNLRPPESIRAITPDIILGDYQQLEAQKLR